LIAFTIGSGYKSGNGVAMIAGHIDALTAKLKPISNKKTTAGYVQLGIAPYAGALNSTWWDRDLGIGGRVLVKDGKGKIVTKLVKLGWPSMSSTPSTTMLTNKSHVSRPSLPISASA
jgi:aminopeptidase I